MQKVIQFLAISAVIIGIGYIFSIWNMKIAYVVGILIELFGLAIVIKLIFFDIRNTLSKVAWITVILGLPVIGTGYYLYFGRDPITRKFSVSQIKETAKLVEVTHAIQKKYRSSDLPRLSKRISNLSKINPLKGNKIDILTNGTATFSAIMEAIKNAKCHIHMQFYIYKKDDIGTEIRDLLVQKAKAGVEVRFMYDAIGAKCLNSAFLKPLSDAGAEVIAFDPILSLWLLHKANFRNHRKVIVVDSHIGFTGGLNVGDEYLSNTNTFKIWRDTHIRIEGLSVIELQESFLNDWIFMKNEKDSATPFINEKGIQKYFSPIEKGADWAQVIYGGPYDKENIIRDAMLNLIESAHENVWIATPYFIPDAEALAVIRRAAMSGIDVRIILPGKGDMGISYHGSNANIKTLLEAGVRVFAYDEESFLHCKIITVDGVNAAIGTANFDIRSFRLNHELMVFLYEASAAIHHLLHDFKIDFQASRELTMADMKNKSFRKQIKESISSLFSPIL
ncbi:cardiolipin synthase [Viridibacillus arvi]|uniref:cardiolipin synthase n=1 Tax=Viridibacillus arvi TaxID=263475 RepID=UPI00187BAC9C|nr:cardiolipin synthase [Viridibacillus sp. JNUCC-6]QOV10611.1 cardiolipin synthase [Viridibacillus sp. JNUCC-6]